MSAREIPVPPASVPALLNHVRSLADFRVRRTTGAYVIEGIRQFVQAYDARHRFQAILHCPILLQAPLAEMLVRRLSAADVRRVRLSPEQFRSISMAERASGIAAIVEQRWTPLEQAHPGPATCHLVVDYIRSPGNLGTILRTAEAAGAGNIFFTSSVTDPFDPAVVRASMGGLFHLPLVRAAPRLLGVWARRHRIRLVALSPRADRLYTDLSPAERPSALLLGEERKGLSADLQALAHTAVRLPMPGRADSLNVATAAAIMIYELLRQRSADVATASPGLAAPARPCARQG